MDDILDCLIVGAGISGLLAARGIKESGYRIQLLEKSRGLGGRMATRRQGEETFDHGAQFITAREPAFRQLIEGWLNEGALTRWYGGVEGDPHPRYRGVPGMTAIAKCLADGLPIERSVRVASLSRSGGAWVIRADDGRAWSARSVVLTAPVPQSLALLEKGGEVLDGDMMASLRAIRYDPCLALMVSVGKGGYQVPPPGWIRPASDRIAWMADNRLKGVSTSERPAVTIHADPEFSRLHYETGEDEVTCLLLDAALPWLKGEVLFNRLHRWRFSHPTTSHPNKVATDPTSYLVFCGDAFGSPRVEGAALSGRAAAEAVTNLLRDL